MSIGDEICLANAEGANLVTETLTPQGNWHAAADGLGSLPTIGQNVVSCLFDMPGEW